MRMFHYEELPHNNNLENVFFFTIRKLIANKDGRTTVLTWTVYPHVAKMAEEGPFKQRKS